MKTASLMGVVAFGLLLVPGPSAAKKATIALFPFVERDDPKQSTVDTVYEIMEEATTFVEGVHVISGKKLAKRIKKPPKKAIIACGSDLKCIARLGKKAKAKEVILARAMPGEGSGVAFAFLAIGVRSKSVERQVRFTVKPKNARAIIGEKIFLIFGVPAPEATLADGTAEEDPLADMALAAIPDPEAGKKPESEPTSPSDEALEPAIPSPDDTVAAVEPKDESETDPNEELGMSLEELPEMPPEKETATAPADSGSAIRLWRWMGVGVAGIGVGVLAGGAAVGSQAKSLESVPDSLTQLQVLDRQREQNDKASKATALMAAGAAITAVGLTAIVLDAVLGPKDPKVSVDVGPDGAAASVLFQF